MLDLSWGHAELAPYYSEIGRPSIDPVLMIRMFIIGYVFAIRSERQICREVQVNLAYRWFCDLGLEDRSPITPPSLGRVTSASARAILPLRLRARRGVLHPAGLVGGEGFAAMRALSRPMSTVSVQSQARIGTGARSRTAARAVKEYLATLNDTAFGAATEVEPKFVSPSDPAAQWTGALKGPAFFAYADKYLIDVRFGITVDVEASRAVRQAGVGAARTMLERTEERFGLKPQRLAADTAYGSPPPLVAPRVASATGC